MGSGIAQVAASAGHDVVLMDTNQQVLDKAIKAITDSTKKLVDKNKIEKAEADGLLARITTATTVEGFSGCGLVIEAVVEKLEIKQELFREIEKHIDSQAILATNTSSLPVVSIANGCMHSERVIGIHFFNPAVLMPLVEIIPALTTHSSVLEEAQQLIRSWGKHTVVAKDTPGFIVNRVARPFYGEAIKIYEEGIASTSTIDWAMKEFGGFRMGPFELMDFIGNDVNYSVSETVWKQLFYDPRYKPSLTQKRLSEAGMLGKKSGKGYYDYTPGAVLPAPDKNEVLGKYIFERILAMLINEAADALYLNIATRDDIDTAMTKGVNYPMGLLGWADTFGIGKVIEILDGLDADYRDGRYRTSLLLRKMKSEVRKFY